MIDEEIKMGLVKRLDVLFSKTGEASKLYVGLVSLGLEDNHPSVRMAGLAVLGENLVKNLTNPDDELDNYCVQAAVYCAQTPYKDGALFYANRWLKQAEEFIECRKPSK